MGLRPSLVDYVTQKENWRMLDLLCNFSVMGAWGCEGIRTTQSSVCKQINFSNGAEVAEPVLSNQSDLTKFVQRMWATDWP